MARSNQRKEEEVPMRHLVTGHGPDVVAALAARHQKCDAG